MTKFNEAVAVSICDFLAGRNVVLDACRAHDISNATFWSWIARSREDPSELPEFEWMNVTAPFFRHVTNAKRIYHNSLLEAATARAHHGTERRIYYQGEEKFAVRTDIPPDMTDPDLLEMFFDQRDRFLRDDKGHLVHLTEKVDPPVALTLAVLAANYESYSPHSSQKIEVINRGDMGVLRVGGNKPKQIEHAGKPTEISGVFTEAVSPPAEIPADTGQRTSEAPIETVLSGVDRNPENPVRVALLAEMAARDKNIAAGLIAKPSHVPQVAVGAVNDPEDRGPDAVSGERVQPAPRPTPDTVALAVHEVKRLVHLKLPMSALQKHVANAIDRGDDRGIRELLGFRPTERDNIGRGDAPAGGAELTGSRPGRGASQKMV